MSEELRREIEAHLLVCEKNPLAAEIARLKEENEYLKTDREGCLVNIEKAIKQIADLKIENEYRAGLLAGANHQVECLQKQIAELEAKLKEAEGLAEKEKK